MNAAINKMVNAFTCDVMKIITFIHAIILHDYKLDNINLQRSIMLSKEIKERPYLLFFVFF